MGSKTGTSNSSFGKFFYVEPEERFKVLFLSCAFFCVIAGYSLAKDLKDSIFLAIVGRDYYFYAKLFSMLVLIPAIFVYSLLVDRMRSYKLFSFYSGLFGFTGLIFAYFIGHETIGIANTDASPYRIFGWLFYFFGEGYSPFVVSVFWAFANSITSPEGAKKNYGLMVSASKVGGALSAGCAWALFSWNMRLGENALSDVTMHQLLLVVSSLFLIMVPGVVYLLMKKVPSDQLHGYEAAYKFEKSKKQEAQSIGMFAGLRMVLTYPYVLGIFGIVYFYEMLGAVIGYLRLVVAQENATNISEVTSFLYLSFFLTHVAGAFISLVGVRWLLETLGERICLLLIPLICGVFLFFFMLYPTQEALMVVFISLRSLNYAFSWPVRESLYIPTVKDIRFKAKSWIDAFGSKFAKLSGSAFSTTVNEFQSSMILPVHSFFFAGLVGLWFIVAFFLGRKFDKVISENKVIGAEPD